MGISNEEKLIKCYYFDLSTENLREIFSSTSNAYTKIKDFLNEQGFEHNQHSGYVSKKPLTNAMSYRILREIAKNFTWLDDCVQKFAVTNAPDEMEMQEFLSQNARNEMKRQFKELQKEVEQYELKKDTLSLDDKQKSVDKIVKLYKLLYKRNFMQADEYKNFLNSVEKAFQIENNDKKLDKKTHSNQLTKEQILTKKLDKEVDYYETKKSVLKPYAKLESQRKIMKLCYDLIQNDMGMSSRNYGVFQSILDERTKGKILP